MLGERERERERLRKQLLLPIRICLSQHFKDSVCVSEYMSLAVCVCMCVDHPLSFSAVTEVGRLFYTGVRLRAQ